MLNLRKCGGFVSILLFVLVLWGMPVSAQDTVTIVQLDPLSGPFKDVGDRME